MLFVEKLENIKTMSSFGASRKFIFKIFFIEGLLISGKGVFSGLIIGYAVCFSQWYFEFVEMPNSNGEAFPIAFSLSDGIMIFSLVAILSVLFSYFPVKYLIKRNIENK
jgi:lipoprotein-releasing system permease protein